VARWRTSAAAAAVVLLVATACGQAEPSHEAAATQTAPAGQPQLAPTGQKPLKVEGTGFQPGEKVQVATKGVPTKTTVADSAGSFVVSLPGVDSCDSINVVANGSHGSHAEFNLSQIACLDPS
jgi:hypothetical protein